MKFQSLDCTPCFKFMLVTIRKYHLTCVMRLKHFNKGPNRCYHYLKIFDDTD